MIVSNPRTVSKKNDNYTSMTKQELEDKMEELREKAARLEEWRRGAQAVLRKNGAR